MAIDDPVYEDYFPIGLVPPDFCPIHVGEQGIAGDLVTTSTSAPITVTRTYRRDGTVSLALKGG